MSQERQPSESVPSGSTNCILRGLLYAESARLYSRNNRYIAMDNARRRVPGAERSLIAAVNHPAITHDIRENRRKRNLVIVVADNRYICQRHVSPRCSPEENSKASIRTENYPIDIFGRRISPDSRIAANFSLMIQTRKVQRELDLTISVGSISAGTILNPFYPSGNKVPSIRNAAERIIRLDLRPDGWSPKLV